MAAGVAGAADELDEYIAELDDEPILEISDELDELVNVSTGFTILRLRQTGIKYKTTTTPISIPSSRVSLSILLPQPIKIEWAAHTPHNSTLTMSNTTLPQAITLKTRHIQDTALEAGIDEAGRGCFWGPLTAAAVILPEEAVWSDKMRALAPKLRDSKKLSPKRRAEYATAIKELAVAWGVGTVMAAELDAHGVTWANQTAFERAVAGLRTQPARLLIDGTLPCKYEHGTVYTIIDGDATYLSIAAASILAKEAHDDWVREFCVREPEVAERFGFATNKGYGTAKHRAALQEHNPHEEHRQRFIYGGGSAAGGYKRRDADTCQIMLGDAEERAALQM